MTLEYLYNTEDIHIIINIHIAEKFLIFMMPILLVSDSEALFYCRYIMITSNIFFARRAN